jgi:hypothetical protein
VCHALDGREDENRCPKGRRSDAVTSEANGGAGRAWRDDAECGSGRVWSERADHKRFTIATDIAAYFCDPKHPWQRCTNENTNGLLRQYFPKAMDLSVYSQAKLNVMARRLNEPPRKTLDD